MTIKESHIHVPCQYNNGGTVEMELIVKYERMLNNLFGGFTKYSVVGSWVDGDKMYTEPMFRYTIAHTQDKSKDLKNIAKEALTDFKQECIYLVLHGEVHFVNSSS